MDVKTAIEESRSIRKYQDKEVSDELINELMDAARLAPSGHNIQPWSYKIVKNIKTKEKLKENKIYKQDFVYDAPLLIVCCTDFEKYPKAEADPGFDDPFELRAIRDLAISSQNIILRATELGLGTCYIGWMNKEKIKDVLDIPKEYVVPYTIIVGYSAEEPKQRPRKSVKEITI